MRTELSANPCLTTRWTGTMQTMATSTVSKSPLPGRQNHDKPVSFHRGLMDMCMCVYMWFKSTLFTFPQSPGALCFQHTEWNNPFRVSSTVLGIHNNNFPFILCSVSIIFLHTHTLINLFTPSPPTALSCVLANSRTSAS